MKIVITGGPGGGKTTALELFRRELLGKVWIIQESASAIFSSGISRDDNEDILKAIQKTIYYYQKNVEEIHTLQHPNKILLCDRGTLDGLAYWPNSREGFFECINSSFEKELHSYDAVIHFETAAVKGQDITTNNPFRNESNEAAIELDNKLKEIWKAHPNFHVVESKGSFIDKIINGVKTIQAVIDQ
ncbi:AAA family ATPase [Halobacteriovorax sp.]|uniref:AAA family ATPase n=1 Tax=Halobacteriovorax sp. TaxID=2020862 RepID=UPI00356165E0